MAAPTPNPVNCSLDDIDLNLLKVIHFIEKIKLRRV